MDIMVQDYTPQKVTGSRFRRQNAKGAGKCTCPLPRKSDGGGLLLDAILQGLSCVKCGKPGCCDLDALSSLGVPTLACLPLTGLEGAESCDLDLLPGHESGRDQAFLAWGEQRFDGGTRFACRKTGLSCNGGDEVGLVHLLFTSL